jgi:hypothetical protein
MEKEDLDNLMAGPKLADRNSLPLRIWTYLPSPLKIAS